MNHQQFQQYLEGHISQTKGLGFQLTSLSETEATSEAPLQGNDNHRGSAFGGSLYNILVLTGYSWLYGGLLNADPNIGLLIQTGQIDYLREVHQNLLGRCQAPAPQLVSQFMKTLRNKGKARIELSSEILCRESGDVLARLQGQFVGVRSDVPKAKSPHGK